MLARTGGLVPEFVNPKYADATKTKFKKPTRLECMMQDHPKVLGPAAKVGATQFNDWTYSPVKNSHAEAVPKVAAGNPGRSALEGEFEYYEASSHALRAAGVALPAPGVFSTAGFSIRDVPKVVYGRGFANSFADFRAKFPAPAAVVITNRSSLVLQGAGIVVESLDLDGALEVHAVPGARVVVRATVRNKGVTFDALPAGGDGAPDWKKIRGFAVTRHEVRVERFTEPGDYVVE